MFDGFSGLRGAPFTERISGSVGSPKDGPLLRVRDIPLFLALSSQEIVLTNIFSIFQQVGI